MAAVLERSALRHCRGWDVNVSQLYGATPPSPLGVPAHAANTRKLEWWAERVASASDGDRLLLVDADVVVLRPLDDLWDKDFDFAYTVRPPGWRLPFNGGVVAVRAGDATKALFRALVDENAQVLQARREKARARYGGCNQAALGSLLERMTWRAVPDAFDGFLPGVADVALPRAEGPETEIRLRLLQLPCVEWNCENSSWAAGAEAPEGIRILHVKDQLRERVFGRVRRSDPLAHLRPLADLWLSAERDLEEVIQ